MSQSTAQLHAKETYIEPASFVPSLVTMARTGFVASQRGAAFPFLHPMFLIIVSISPLFSTGVNHPASAAASEKQPTFALQAGSVTERELPGGELHTYMVRLSRGELLYTCVDQLGIDVVLTLYSPARSRLLTINRYARGRGTEQIWWVAETTGAYRLQVRSRERDGVGSYRLRVMPLREASEDDRSHVSAQRVFAEAWRLREQGTPQALREAIGKLETVLAYWRGTDNLRERANLMNILGGVHHRLNDDNQALDFYGRALPLWKSLKDEIGEAWTLNDIGDIYFERGERQKALEHFKRALQLYQSIGLPREQAVALTTLAKAYASLGEQQKALDALRQALTYWRWKLDRRGEAQAFHLMGDIYASLGDEPQALQYFKRSLQIRQAIHDQSGQAGTFNKIGEVYASLGEFSKALSHCRKALEIARSLGDRRQEIRILCNVSAIELHSGNAAQALKELHSVLPISRTLRDPAGEALALRQMGEVHLSLGSPSKTADLCQRALVLFARLGDIGSQAETLFVLARAYRNLGEMERASLSIETALDHIESQRSRIDFPETRNIFLAAVRDYYDFCIDLWMQRHRENPTAGYAAVAFASSERARARGLVEAFVESGTVARNGLGSGLLRRKRNLQESLNKTNSQPGLIGAGKAETAAAEAKAVEVLLKEYSEVEKQIQAARPRVQSRNTPPHPSLVDIQSYLLDDQTLLLEYALGEERSYLWAVTKDSLASFELPSRKVIERTSREVYELVTERNEQPTGETETQRPRRLQRAEKLVPRATAKLGRILLGPVADQLDKAQRLLIVAEGSLQYLPFSVLPVTAMAEDGGKHGTSAAGEAAAGQPPVISALAVRHEVVYLPSASALLTWRREFAHRPLAAKMAAVLADPVFEQDDPRVRQIRSSASGKSAAMHRFLAGKSTDPLPRQSRLTQALRDVQWKLGSWQIPRLFYSRQEATSILAWLPEQQRKAALDFEANLATATSAELGQYRILHFATHSLLNNARPELSGLVLSLVNQEGRPQDGFLPLREIYNLNLSADLVVLSACQTGLGKIMKGEGLIGMTRGFMIAGAARVVSSLWKVDDKATAELMKRFYQGMLGDQQLSPAAALRGAQLSLAKEKAWVSPYYWAGFVLHGEWR